MPVPTVVLDTNVFVSAGFNAHSHSARIIDAVREGRLRMVWTEGTQAEVRHTLKKIPPLNWDDFAALFREEDRYEEEIHPEHYDHVEDEADRKFLALAEGMEAILISHDDHLLAHAGSANVPIVTPESFLE